MKLAMVMAVAMVAVGCASGAYCDELQIARCPDPVPGGDAPTAFCTLDGAEPEWAASGPQQVINGSSGTCDTSGRLYCRPRPEWSDEQNARLVMGCYCPASRPNCDR